MMPDARRGTLAYDFIAYKRANGGIALSTAEGYLRALRDFLPFVNRRFRAREIPEKEIH